MEAHIDGGEETNTVSGELMETYTFLRGSRGDKLPRRLEKHREDDQESVPL